MVAHRAIKVQIPGGRCNIISAKRKAKVISIGSITSGRRMIQTKVITSGISGMEN